MSQELPSIFYLANCGVFIRWNGASILIDGLMSNSSGFDCIPAAAENGIIAGYPPYGRIDLLAFSHLHPDHFDRDKLLRFKKVHRETSLFIPPDFIQEDSNSSGQIEASDFCLSGSRLLPAFQSSPCGGLRFEYLLTKHIASDRPQHQYCLKLSCGECSLLFCADMDFDELSRLADYFSLRSIPRLTAFFNPFLLARREWVEAAASWKPERVFIYHLPAQDIDRSSYRSLALKRASRYRQLLPQLELLAEPMQLLIP